MKGPQSADDVILNIEVAYALPHRQLIIPLQVPAGTTVREALLQSGIADRFDELNLQDCQAGIFGSVVGHDQTLSDGQRVEIYRPLRADPKEVRRQLAAMGKTMGGGGKKCTPG